MLNKKLNLPTPQEALPGRARPIRTASRHFVSKRALKGPYAQGLETALFGLGNFWGAERLFWPFEGVWVTAAGFAGGLTANPTYQELCTGLTGHAEVVQIVFDPTIVSYGALLKLFWESHNPTQGMRQGNDIGTLYRSMILVSGEAQREAALVSRDVYQKALQVAGYGTITTEIAPASAFYFAEQEHQQYLARNPASASSLKGTGVALEILG
jgi:peptide-methionine (S)-S-oxide reductase